MNPELDKLAADIVEGLLKDLGGSFTMIGLPMKYIDADLYGWKVARAEALADRMKKEALLAAAMSSRALESIVKEALRDEFAMRAPAEVPEWFEHTPPPNHPGREPLPDLKDPEQEEGYGDLPHHEQGAKRAAYCEAFNAAWKALEPERAEWKKKRVAWLYADHQTRFIQWRWHYADQMIAARDPEPQPDATVEAPRYDPTFGDDALCACGHPYYRHFDTHEDMAPVGCKYCYCDRFQKEPPK